MANGKEIYEKMKKKQQELPSAEQEQKQMQSEMSDKEIINEPDQIREKMFKRKKARPVNEEELRGAFKYKRGY